MCTFDSYQCVKLQDSQETTIGFLLFKELIIYFLRIVISLLLAKSFENKVEISEICCDLRKDPLTQNYDWISPFQRTHHLFSSNSYFIAIGEKLRKQLKWKFQKFAVI